MECGFGALQLHSLRELRQPCVCAAPALRVRCLPPPRVRCWRAPPAPLYILR